MASLALCSAMAAGSCTELTGPGYARQAISFGAPRKRGLLSAQTAWAV